MTLETQINEIKEREIVAFEYRGEFRVRESSAKPSFRGRMNLSSTGNAEVTYNPTYQQESEGLQNVVRGDPFTHAITKVIQHELNHRGGGNFRGCPKNLDLHLENVLDPVAETLQRLEYPNVAVSADQTLYAYIANLVEDIIDNTELGNKSDGVGMALCYKDDAQQSQTGKFPPLFDAFVQIQERLYGGRRSARLLRDHHSNDPRVDESVKAVLERTGLSELTKIVRYKRGNSRVVLDRRSVMNYLLEENNWRDVSAVVAEEFIKLLDKDQLANPIYIRANVLPLSFEDGFKEELRNPELRMKVVVKKYERAKESNSSFTPPAYLDTFESLDLVYQKLARDLEIKTRPSTTTVQMPLVEYGRRPFDPEKDRVARIKARMTGSGELELMVRAHQEYEEVEYTERIPHPPTMKFAVLDTSGSMKRPIKGTKTGVIMNPWAKPERQWTDVSRYHYSLLAFYGLLELAKQQGTLKHNNVLLANYSTETKTAQNLADAKKLALTPQFGSTTLSMDKVRDMFGKGQLVISTSDADIENWDAIKVEYIRRARDNQYFHIQMGDFSKDAQGVVTTKPKMCQDLEKAGLRVYYEEGENLGKLVLDITRPYISRRRVQSQQ